MAASLLGVVLVVVIGIGGLVLWIWALVDAIRTRDGQFRAGTQLIWILVILFGNLIGAIVYLAVGRPSAAMRT